VADWSSCWLCWLPSLWVIMRSTWYFAIATTADWYRPVSAAVSLIPDTKRYYWNRPDSDTEYWYRFKPSRCVPITTQVLQPVSQTIISHCRALTLALAGLSCNDRLTDLLCCVVALCGPDSCRIGLICFLARLHKRPLNQALVSFALICAMCMC